MSGQHPHTNEGLSNSVSSTPSSSVHPLELPPQDMMSNQLQQDQNIHVQGQSMVGPGDVSMDGTEDQNNQSLQMSKSEQNAANASTPASNSGGKESSSKDGAKTKDKRERLSKPVSRACVACHTGKTRCSNTLPCESCVKRGIASSCAYPDPMDNSDPSANHPIAPRRRAAHGGTHASPASMQGGSPHPNQGVPMAAGGNQQPQSSQTVFSAGPTVRGFYYDNGSGSNQTFAAPSAPGSNGQLMSPVPSGNAMGVGIRREPTPPQPGNSRPLKKARYRNLTESEIATFHPKPYRRGTFYVGESAPVTIDPRLPLRLLLADEERVDFFVGDGLPP